MVSGWNSPDFLHVFLSELTHFRMWWISRAGRVFCNLLIRFVSIRSVSGSLYSFRLWRRENTYVFSVPICFVDLSWLCACFIRQKTKLITAQSMMGWNKDIYLRPGSHWRLKGLSLKSRHYTFLKHQQDLVASSAAERTRTCFFLIEP